MTDLRQTVFYPLHRELGAKMVAFAGYCMPLRYPAGVIAEHHHTRAAAGLFDISHMGQFLLGGASAARQLEKLCPGDITGLQSGQQKYTVFTNDQGGIIDDLIITRLDEEYHLVVNAACKAKDYAHLQRHLPGDCRLRELSGQALLALQGPRSAEILEKYCPEASALAFMSACKTEIHGMPCQIARCGYTGEDGFEIAIANEQAMPLARMLLAEDAVQAIGLGARDTLRLEAGLSLYGHELNETVTPVEAGLAWLVKNQRGSYPCSAIIQRQLQQGPPCKRIGLRPEGRILLREGAALCNAAGERVGTVTSGGFGPTVGGPIAMARVATTHSAPGTSLYATIRNHQVAVTSVSLPFVPHHYHRP